ncbi:rna-directed dna polymerase from mobile element jockey-like [Pitangus sulphuratus]|nr:rna-directed dna polymerase from mobile element jockey-like [Pitangus sulphuratus]
MPIKCKYFTWIGHDLDIGLEGILSKCADDTKLEGHVDSLEDREDLQRDLDKSEDWAITNHMKFKKGKCRTVLLGWGNPGCSHRLWNEMLESSAMEKVLGGPGQWQVEYESAVPWQPGGPTLS